MINCRGPLSSNSLILLPLALFRQALGAAWVLVRRAFSESGEQPLFVKGPCAEGTLAKIAAKMAGSAPNDTTTTTT